MILSEKKLSVIIKMIEQLNMHLKSEGEQYKE